MYKSSLIFLFIITISIYSKAQCPLNINQTPTINTNGQILYYPFNGNTINQGSGSYTATISGATYSTGICGQAMEFDGVDDFVKIDPFISLTGNYTVSAWIYINNMQNSMAVFTTRDQCATTYRGYSQGEIFINYYNTASSNFPQELNYNVNVHQNCTGYSHGDRYNAVNYTFATGSWHLITVSVQNNSSESRIIKYYIDCQQYTNNQHLNTSTAAAFSPNNNNKTFIGAVSEVNNFIYSFNGKIDEFRLFNRVLPIDEVLDLYHSCKPLDINISTYNGICTGDSAFIELENTQTGVSYQLYDSTNQQFIGGSINGGCNTISFSTGLITSSTDFYIKATDTGCTVVLDTIISLNPNSGASSNYYDTINVCLNESILINGNLYYPPASIIDSMLSVAGCDSINHTILLAVALPQIDLGNDTSICNGDSINLQIPSTLSNITWSTGSNQPSIWANTAGQYWVVASDTMCSNSDTININNSSTTIIDINDTSFCIGYKWLITLPTQNQYQWFNGSTNNSIVIVDSGDYWVNITDKCKTYKDYFSVHTIDCYCQITIPNAFTPNGDGINDVFFPVINCRLDIYRLYIFNRWGDLIFESFNQDETWDGRYKGSDVTDGVYFYRMEYLHEETNENEDYKTGSVTILR